MYKKRVSTISGAILLASAAFTGPMSVTSSNLATLPQAQAEPVYYRCHGYYGWVPDGTIAGPTGGYPFYGWYGYPYLTYRYCGRPHYRRYGYSPATHTVVYGY